MNSIRIVAVCLLALLFALPNRSCAEDSSQAQAIEALKAQVEAMKINYETRIKDLEEQVQQLQIQRLQAPEAGIEAPTGQQPAVQTIPGALNPAIAVASNFVGRADSDNVFNEDGNRIDSKLNLREAEIDMRVPIDPYADGVLITSLESETPGEFGVDVEEGYVNVKKLPFVERMPLGLKLKVGRYRPLFGQTNVLHTHDLPTTFRSLPISEFLGEEGFNANGVSANFFLPTPWDQESSLDATVDVLTGGHIAVSPDQQATLSYLGHVRWFRTFSDVNSVQLGWSSYFHPKGNDVTEADIHSFDFFYRWKPIRMGEWKSYLLGGELMFGRKTYPRAAEPADVEQAIEADNIPSGEGKPFGYSIFTQWQFNRRVYSGVRWDQTDILYNPDFNRKSITPYVSYYFSEFLRFRIDFEHRWSDLSTENGRNSLYFELNWIFGAHPPEPFWVNK